MVQLYNFLGSWQLFPEKGNYEFGQRPKSGTYKIEGITNSKQIRITQSLVSLENDAMTSEYIIAADGTLHAFEERALAEEAQVVFTDSITFEIHFYTNAQSVLHVHHEIQPNGYLKITTQGNQPAGQTYTNTDYYHRQLSVLPYAAGVAGAIVKPTEEGVIKHKALLAMEEQTNMQLDQIRRQIELLALQAQEIQKRKELSQKIYTAQLAFKPNIGQTYYLYEKKDGNYMLSLVAPKEWGGHGPFKKFESAVQLLADHTWKELY